MRSCSDAADDAAPRPARPPQMIDVPDSDRRTPLILATMGGFAPVMRLLLALPEAASEEAAGEKPPEKGAGAAPRRPKAPTWKGADRYAEDRLKRTALHYALAATDLAAVAILLGSEGGAPASAASVPEEMKEVLRRTVYEGGVTPLMKFVTSDPGMVNLFLQSGADPNAVDARRRTALMYLAAGCHTAGEEVVRASLGHLLDREAEVAAQDALGRTALHYAAHRLQDGEAAATLVFREILEKDPGLLWTADAFGRLPVTYAAMYGFGEQAFKKVFSDHQTKELAAADSDGMNPLLWAAYAGREETPLIAKMIWSSISWDAWFSVKLEYCDLLMLFQPQDRLGVIEILASKKTPVNFENVVRSRCSEVDGEDARAHAAMAFALHFGRLAAVEEARRDEYEEMQKKALALAEKLLDEAPADSPVAQRKLVVDLGHKTAALNERKRRAVAARRDTKRHEAALEEHKYSCLRALKDGRRGALQYLFGGQGLSADERRRLLAGLVAGNPEAESRGEPPALFDTTHELFDALRGGKDVRFHNVQVLTAGPDHESEEQRAKRGFLCGISLKCMAGAQGEEGEEEISTSVGTTWSHRLEITWTDLVTEEEAEAGEEAAARDIVGLRLWYDELPEDYHEDGEPTRAVCGVEVARAARGRPGKTVSTLIGRNVGPNGERLDMHDIRVPADHQVVGMAGLARTWLFDLGLVVRPRGPLFASKLKGIMEENPAPAAPAAKEAAKPEEVKEGAPRAMSIIEMALEIGPSAGKILAHPRVAERLSSTWRGETKAEESLLDQLVIKPIFSVLGQWRAGGKPGSRAAEEEEEGPGGGVPAWNLFARKDAVFGTPRGKFFLEFLFYIFLLATFTLALNWQTEGVNGADLLLLALIASFVVAESSQVLQDGWKYFFNVWNVADVIMVLIFAAYYIIRLKNVFDFSHADVVTAYRILAFNSILLWTRLLNTCDLHPTLGPLLTIIKNMATDTLTFLVVLLLVMLGFSQLIHLLIIRVLEENEQRPGDTVLLMFKTILGDGDIDFVIEHSSTVGFLIYSFYLIFSVIMLLNLLIAVYGGTYGKIADRAENQFQFTRAETYLEYAGREYVPPPFNLIQFAVRCLLEWPLGLVDRCFCVDKVPEKRAGADDDEYENADEEEPAPTALGRAVDGLGTKVSSVALLLVLLPFAVALALPVLAFQLARRAPPIARGAAGGSDRGGRGRGQMRHSRGPAGRSMADIVSGKKARTAHEGPEGR
eukprot:tig00000828_g4642.t1